MHNKESPVQNHLEDLLDARVDHIMLINEMGRVESTVSKSEICLSRERQEIFFMGFRLHQSLLQEFDSEFGPVKHVVIHRSNAKMVFVPLGSKSLLFVMDNELDHEFVVRKTEELRDRNFNMSEPEPLCAEVVING